MSTAVLRIYAPLSDRRKRQTFREAGVEWAAINGERHHVKPRDLDAEWFEIVVPAPPCECHECLTVEATHRC
jgi:hypothetical protein